MRRRKITIWLVEMVLIVLCLGLHHAQATTVFDTFTPPYIWGGFSSPNAGVATLIAVNSNTEITGISILNQMLSQGELKFVIIDGVSHNFVYVSESKQFSAETTTTWKQSNTFSFEMFGGKSYFVGYMRSVGVNEYVDNIRESYNGFTSGLSVASLSNYSNPAFSHVCFTGVDEAVRLSVPEPATLLLLGLGGMILRRHRKS